MREAVADAVLSRDNDITSITNNKGLSIVNGERRAAALHATDAYRITEKRRQNETENDFLGHRHGEFACSVAGLRQLDPLDVHMTLHVRRPVPYRRLCLYSCRQNGPSPWLSTF